MQPEEISVVYADVLTNGRIPIIIIATLKKKTVKPMYLQESCVTPSHSKDTSCVSKARNPRENRTAAVQGMNYVAGLLLLVSQNEVPRPSLDHGFQSYSKQRLSLILL